MTKDEFLIKWATSDGTGFDTHICDRRKELEEDLKFIQNQKEIGISIPFEFASSLDINKKCNGSYSIFTVPTQRFIVKSLSELTQQKFEEQKLKNIKQQKYPSDLSEEFHDLGND